MKKVLITGMSAQHTSKRLAERTTTFAGVLAKSLNDHGIMVVHREPWIVKNPKELSEYHAVVVGVSPTLSLSANHTYGALSIIEAMYSNEKLRLMIDASDPEKIVANLRSVHRQPEQLVKPLYKKRKSYATVVENAKVRSKLNAALENMLLRWTPKTIFPASIGIDESIVARRLNFTTAENVTAINVDALLINTTAAVLSKTNSQLWCVDAVKSKWFETAKHGITWNYVPMKSHKGETDTIVEARLLTCSGAVISPSNGGLFWWNPRIHQSINAGTPIVTDWRVTAQLGESWTYLPYSIESMSHGERIELAAAQRNDYVSSMPDTQETNEKILKELGL